MGGMYLLTGYHLLLQATYSKKNEQGYNIHAPAGWFSMYMQNFNARRTAVAQDERFTKGTAMALRAKIALFAGGYSLKGTGTIGTMNRLSNYLDFYQITRGRMWYSYTEQFYTT